MLVRPIEAIKDYVRLNYTMDSEHDLTPTLLRAENKFIVPYLGREQYDLLVTANNSDVLTADQEKLLHYISGALYNYAIKLNLPFINVQITGMGITQQHTDKSKPAFQHAIIAVEEGLLDAAYEWLEWMLEFLEENENDFPIWRNSTAYTKNKECFINTATRFNECYNIQCKRQTFHAIRPVMKDMENFAILPIIGETYFNELKAEIANKNISVNNTTPVNLIQKALANFTIVNAIKANWVSLKGSSIIYRELIETRDSSISEKAANNTQLKVKIEHAEQMGNMYLSQLTDYLNSNLDNYPSYKAYLEEVDTDDCDCTRSENSVNPRDTNCNNNNSAIYVG